MITTQRLSLLDRYETGRLLQLCVVLGYVLGSIAHIFGFLYERDKKMKDKEWEQ